MGALTPPGRPPARPSSNGIALGAICATCLSVPVSFVLFVTQNQGGQLGQAACKGRLPAAVGLTAGLAILTGLALVALFGWKRRGFWPDFLRAALVVGTLFFLIPWPCGATLGVMETFASCR